jgi:hypothetical protein
LEGGSSNYFNPYTYVRNVAEGGIVGLQQGGMATPQAPSAMSAMLAQPMQQQQPVPINIAVQPMQQQQPMQQSTVYAYAYAGNGTTTATRYSASS